MILGHAHPAVVEAVRARRRRRPVVRRADRRRGRAGRGDHRPGGAGRAGAPGQLRHRGHHERDPAGPRLHRPRRRSSSSPAATTATSTRCSPTAGSGVATLGLPHIARRHRRRRPPTRSSCPTTTSTPSRAAFAELGADDRLRHHRGRRRATWAPSRRVAGLQRRRCARSPPSTARCSIVDEVMTGFRVSPSGWYGLDRRRRRPLHLRQGDERRAARGRVRRSRRGDGATSRPPGPCTRRARCREPGRGGRRARDAAGRRRRRLRRARRQRRPARRRCSARR